MRIVEAAGYENFVLEREDKTGTPEVLIAHVSTTIPNPCCRKWRPTSEQNWTRKMKPKVQAAMARRQERLYVQRRRLAVQQRLEQLRSDEEAQRAARGRPSQRVAEWWRPDDDRCGTRQDSTRAPTSGTRSSRRGRRWTLVGVGQRVRATVAGR
jgi:hypothetical protein